ncbi:MAG TPA: protealysin inhibitor emfourin [Propionibacteriaceae bacterium]
MATITGDRHLLGCSEQTLRVDDELRAKRESTTPRTYLLAPSAAGRRVIHTAANTETLPGEVARGDVDPATGDEAVDEAYESSGQVWDLFSEKFGRRSVDGEGTTVTITVHYGRNYDNAFWDGDQLVFGDGDGEIFDRFTKPMDVMAHEFAHGVTQFSAGLVYQGQSGALNESVSDVFAAMTKQLSLGQTAEQADWLIGEGLFLPAIKAKALRSMLEPGTAYDDPRVGKDPQVGSMADYVDTSDDNGGVHVNSGIPNRAFALAAIGVGGSSWEKTGQAWYDALTGGVVKADTDFVGFARATVDSAARLFPDDPSVSQAVEAAWVQVGVLAGGTGAEPSTPSPPPAETVAVRRSGGFTGAVRSAEIDLDADPQGAEVRRLMMRVDLQQITVSRARPDRFVYTVQYGDIHVTVPEQDLTPELDQVVKLVLDRGRLDLP